MAADPIRVNVATRAAGHGQVDVPILLPPASQYVVADIAAAVSAATNRDVVHMAAMVGGRARALESDDAIPVAAVAGVDLLAELGHVVDARAPAAHRGRLVSALILGSSAQDAFRLDVPVPGDARRVSGAQLFELVGARACQPVVSITWIAIGEDVDPGSGEPRYATRTAGKNVARPPQVSVLLDRLHRRYVRVAHDGTVTKVLAPLCVRAVTPQQLYKLVEAQLGVHVRGLQARHAVTLRQVPLSRQDSVGAVEFHRHGGPVLYIADVKDTAPKAVAMSATVDVQLPVSYVCGRQRGGATVTLTTDRSGSATLQQVLEGTAQMLPRTCVGDSVDALTKQGRKVVFARADDLVPLTSVSDVTVRGVRR